MTSPHRTLPLFGILFLFLLAPTVAVGQQLPAGPQVLSFYSEIDDAEQPYALYLPPDFDENREYPLVISLHGAGSNHRLNLRRVFGKSNTEGENDVEASRYFPEWEDVDYIVASPFARGTMGYQGVAEKDVLDVLADVKRRFPIDENRVYLTGLSMGGGGTMWIGLTRPDLWAALAPVCPAPPRATETFAPNALHLPMHVFQGGDDPVVRPEGTRRWVERLKDFSPRVEYVEYPGVGHESWEQAYADGQIFDWFDQFERDPHPSRVRFVSDRYKYDEAYWVRLNRLTPGVTASIDARIVAPDEIEVSTSDLRGFTLLVREHPGLASQEPLTVRIDGATLEVPVGESPSFSMVDGSWALGMHRNAGMKRRGAEGPMTEVVADRHIYVYGTADDPSREQVQERREQALEAATWSDHRGSFLGRVMVFPRVIADREVRPSDLETSNLVLFGTAETNSVIADLSDRLPLHLSPDAEGYGLTYVYPVDDNYVLVSSGEPWWNAPGPGGGSFFAMQIPALSLSPEDDFVLFNTLSEEVLSRGRFDNNWRVPEAPVEEMTSTGVVRISED